MICAGPACHCAFHCFAKNSVRISSWICDDIMCSWSVLRDPRSSLIGTSVVCDLLDLNSGLDQTKVSQLEDSLKVH